MLYENQTETRIELIRGDIRDATDAYVVIGRNAELKSHYEQLTCSKFETLNSLLIDPKVQICRSEKLSVIRTTHRPKYTLKQPLTQARELQFAVQTPIALEFSNAKTVAMTPISFRQPGIVSRAMIRMIWDISVASFFKVKRSYEFIKPRQFTIFCDGPLDPFVDELENGHYASLKHALLLRPDVHCSPGVRKRYFANNRFKFFRVSNGA